MVATLVLLFSILLPSQTPVSAYVQIDINPSVELGLDQEGTVYSFKGLNDDGEALKRDIDFWKGKPLTWVLLQIVDRTETTIETQEEIEITTIYENKENHAKLEKVIVSAVSNSNSKSMMQKYSVNVNEASLEDRQAANNEGISVQKYKAQFKDNKVEKQQEIKKKDENKKHDDNNKLQKENKKESQIPAVDMKDHKNTHNKSKQNPQHQKQESKQAKPNKKWDKPAKSEEKTQSHQNQTNPQNDSNREGKDNGQSKTKGNHPSEKKTNSDHQHDNHLQDKKGKNKDHERKDNNQKRKQEKSQSGKEQSKQGKNNNHKNH
ncbi:hypothetical protein MHH33_12515 [Paenisporosarcina sp. FSL H8-0542]|uniref:anti-sigma-I factor RsgI family protein n=1 Tax=Paenisporosarcina sp. FSL H8-0542 TaxID=2921401 RepID=UPI00315A8974